MLVLAECQFFFNSDFFSNFSNDYKYLSVLNSVTSLTPALLLRDYIVSVKKLIKCYNYNCLSNFCYVQSQLSDFTLS